MARPAHHLIDTLPADLQTILRDVYRHLTAAGDTGPAGPSGASGSIFYDRGDPASPDWDETDLTADGSWHDLDLSAIIPPQVRLVLLRINLAATVQSLTIREKGNSNTANAILIETGGGAGIHSNDCFVVPNASGVVEYMLSGEITSVDITVGGWWA